MRRDRIRRPQLVSLESICLLSTYDANIARIRPQVVFDLTDPTNHTAWAFPGMKFTVEVNANAQGLPAAYMGIESVSYVFLGQQVFDPEATE